ncbi:MAG TPA: VOC family protein [Gemmatimonadaceae bacterium]
MKAINAYLNFDGNTGEAMRFYAKCLDADLQIQTFKDAGMDAPGAEDRVIHARLEKGGAILMASDSQPGTAVKQGDNVWLSVDCDSQEEQDRMFTGLTDGGQVVMPLDTTFWGARFGMLRDRYGIGWMFNLELKK